MDIFKSINQWAANQEFLNQSVSFFSKFFSIQMSPWDAFLVDIVLVTLSFHVVTFGILFMTKNKKSVKSFDEPGYVVTGSKIDDVFSIINFRSMKRYRKVTGGPAFPLKKEKK
ncbi:MAG: hypothetical protein ACHQYP_08490 [Nitrospiria bacterium]